MDKKTKSICDDCVHEFRGGCLSDPKLQHKAQSTGKCKMYVPEEPGFSLHADPDAWNFKPICYDCVNKNGGSCYVFEEDGEAPNPHGQHEAQSTGKCEWYIKHTKIK